MQSFNYNSPQMVTEQQSHKTNSESTLGYFSNDMVVIRLIRHLIKSQLHYLITTNSL